MGGPGKAACLGTLMHELVQAALSETMQGTLPLAPAPTGPARPFPIPRSAPCANPASRAFLSRRTRPHSGLCVSLENCGWLRHRSQPHVSGILTFSNMRAGAAQDRTRALHAAVRAFMLDRIPALLAASAFELAEAGLSQREAETKLRETTGRLAATVATHTRGEQPPHARGAPPQGTQPAPVSLEGLVDIEESVWAPKYGMKGVIDATMIARYPAATGGSGGGVAAGAAGGAAAGPQAAAAAEAARSDGLGLAPVEFKSGKRFYTHGAQVQRFFATTLSGALAG